MFGLSKHPSSGVLKTVPAASGTGHSICTATPLRVLIGTGLCESSCICWIFIHTELRCTEPRASKKKSSFYLHVVGRKFHTEIFVSPLPERCWHGLGMSHDHPCLWEDQPQLLITSEDWTHVTISTGLATTLSSGVTCVQRRRDANCAIQMCQV